MAKSYINCYMSNSNQITHKYIENGIKKVERVNFQPILGYRTKEESNWTDIYGNYIKAIRFPCIADARNWRKENSSLFDVYGDISEHLAFIGQNYSGEIKLQKQAMKILNFDIEVYVSGTGFPKASNPENFINAITFQDMVTNQYTIFGLKDYTPTKNNIKYFKCRSEQDLLETVLDFISKEDVDILTGFNIRGFDIPYIIDRLILIMGESAAKRLSPDRKITKSTKIVNKRETDVYDIQGIITYDYLELIQKFTYENLESYSLDYVSGHFLGREKLKYKEEYGDLNSLYEQNFTKFIDYNCLDVQLVYELDQKLKFIDVAISYAYSMFCGLEDIHGTVKPWDSRLYHILYNKGILCSPNKISANSDTFMGGYVKDPIRGFHKWSFVYDIVSSYPNQIIQYNLSPETILSEADISKNNELRQIKSEFSDIDKCVNIDSLKNITSILKKYNVTFTTNGQFFRLDKQGFIPEIVEQDFNYRISLKKLVKELKSKKSSLTNNDEIISLELEIEQLETLILIIKIKINSLYGFLSTPFSRYYDLRLSQAVTYQGQLSVKGVGNYIATNQPDLEWIYSDTDSNVISVSNLVNKRFKNNLPDKETVCKFILKYQQQVIEPIIEEFFSKLNTNLNTFKPAVKMEAECIADTSIFLEKKKYAMSQIWKEGDWFLDKPKLKVKGIEVVRSSTPQIVRDKLKTALEMIFKTGDNQVLIEFIDDFKKEFFTMPFEAVAFPRGVKFADYNINSKALPIHVRAAFIYNATLKSQNLHNKYKSIGDGSKIKFCYIKQPNLIGSDVLGILDKLPTELKKMFQIDYEKQFNKTFLSPLEKIFTAINWQIEKTNTLEDFFS